MHMKPRIGRTAPEVIWFCLSQYFISDLLTHKKLIHFCQCEDFFDSQPLNNPLLYTQSFMHHHHQPQPSHLQHQTITISQSFCSHQQINNQLNQQQNNSMNNMMVQDNGLWEDITAGICDDFEIVKTEPNQHQNDTPNHRYHQTTQSIQSISNNNNQHPVHPYSSSIRHSPGQSAAVYGNLTANSNEFPNSNSALSNGVPNSTTSSNIIHVHPTNRVLLYLPPTPPNSEPGSPSTQQVQQQQQHHQQHQHHQQQHSHSHSHSHHHNPHQNQRRTPPPPYACIGNSNGPLQGSMATTMHLTNGISTVGYHHQQVTQQSPQQQQTISQQQTTRYNRRNNPELEKRRIHRCDYPGLNC